LVEGRPREKEETLRPGKGRFLIDMSRGTGIFGKKGRAARREEKFSEGGDPIASPSERTLLNKKGEGKRGPEEGYRWGEVKVTRDARDIETGGKGKTPLLGKGVSREISYLFSLFTETGSKIFYPLGGRSAGPEEWKTPQKGGGEGSHRLFSLQGEY